MPATFDIVQKIWNLCNVLRGDAKSPRVQAIFANAQTSVRQPRHLHTLVSSIAALDWYSARREGFGDLYEGLLQKNAEESRSGAGQYFTPRPLIDSMVALMKPRPGEVVHEPAADTLTQSLLAKAFRGDLVPQDPKDEPASVVLARLRKERESAARKPAKRATRKRASSIVRKNQRKTLQES